MSGGRIDYPPINQSVQTQNLINISLSGNTSGALALISSGTMTLAGGNNITLSQVGNAVTLSGPNTSIQSAFILSTSNGVTFGTNGSTVTASVKTDYQSSNANYLTSQSSQIASAANGSYAFQILSFSNANNMSFGTSAGSAITGSYTVPTVTNSSWTVSDSVTSATVGRLAFTNSNGVTMTLSTSNNGNHTLIGSVRTDYQSSGAYLTTADLSQNSSKYVQEWALTGNTAGTTSSAQGTRMYFSGGNNITLSGSSNTIVVSAGGGGAGDGYNILAAGTQTANTTGSVLFQSSNGITFGMSNNSIITATVKTDYQTSGAYLTTAALSQNTSNYAGINSAITGGSLTVNTSGISINLPAYLTTARASTDAIGLNTAQTNVTWTVNSSGISLNAGGYAGTGFSSTTTAGTAIVGTHNTAGLSLGVPAYLTTAALSQNTSNYAGINSAITGGSMTVNTSGVSINLPAYLTTALASNASTQFVQANAGFNGTNASGTIASNAISVSVNPTPLIKNFTMPDMYDGSFGSSNGFISYVPLSIPANLSATRVMLLASMSGASNSTGALNYGIQVMTLSQSTAGEVSSASTAISWSSSSAINSTTNNQYGGQSGVRYRSLTIGTFNFTPGNYLIGQWMASANAGTWGVFGSSGISWVAPADINETQNWQAGYSTSSIASWSARATSLNITATNFVRSGSNAGRQLGVILLGTL